MSAREQPQNGPAAGSTNRLLREFDRLFAVRKCIIFTNNKEKGRKEKTQRTIILLFRLKGKSLNIIQKG